MANWTTPKTWSNGELVAASEMNVYLRDNMTHLNDWLGKIGYAEDAPGETTVPGSDTTLLTTNITIPTGGRDIKVTAVGYFYSTNAGDTVRMRLLVDGQVKMIGKVDVGTSSDPPRDHIVLVRRISAPASGSTEFKIDAQRLSGSGTMKAKSAGDAPIYIMVEAL